MVRIGKKFLIFDLVVLLLLGGLFLYMCIAQNQIMSRATYTVCDNNNIERYLPQSTPSGAISFGEDEQAYYVGASPYDFTVDISKTWVENPMPYLTGSQYDLTFFNKSSYDLGDWIWQIKVSEDSVLDSFWNGDFVFEDGIITITSMSYNENILSGSSVDCGFILISQGIPQRIEDCTMIFYRKGSLSAHPLFWPVIILAICVGLINLSYGLNYYQARKYQKRKEADAKIINQSLLTISDIIDAKDEYTRGHSTRVAIYSREIAKRMGMSEEKQKQLYHIALLHDIGKIGIPDGVLNKPGALTEEERDIIKQHVSIGGKVLQNFTSIPGIVEGAMYHHERYDGKGYAAQLSGDGIPLFARIICIADSFDAMTSSRCYRKALPIDVVVSEIEKNAGSQFDPSLTGYILSMIKDGFAPIPAAAET